MKCGCDTCGDRAVDSGLCPVCEEMRDLETERLDNMAEREESHQRYLDRLVAADARLAARN